MPNQPTKAGSGQLRKMPIQSVQTGSGQPLEMPNWQTKTGSGQRPLVDSRTIRVTSGTSRSTDDRHTKPGSARPEIETIPHPAINRDEGKIEKMVSGRREVPIILIRTIPPKNRGDRELSCRTTGLRWSRQRSSRLPQAEVDI